MTDETVEKVVDLLRTVDPKEPDYAAKHSPAAEDFQDLVRWARDGELAIETNLGEDLKDITESCDGLTGHAQKVWGALYAALQGNEQPLDELLAVHSK